MVTTHPDQVTVITVKSNDGYEPSIKHTQWANVSTVPVLVPTLTRLRNMNVFDLLHMIYTTSDGAPSEYELSVSICRTFRPLALRAVLWPTCTNTRRRPRKMSIRSRCCCVFVEAWGASKSMYSESEAQGARCAVDKVMARA